MVMVNKCFSFLYSSVLILGYMTYFDVSQVTSMIMGLNHTGEFPRGVGHRVENGWGLTKVAVVLLNGLIW